MSPTVDRLLHPVLHLWLDHLQPALIRCILAAIDDGDELAQTYFSSASGSPSVYVPFGFRVAQLFGVAEDSNLYISSRGEGFRENHLERIRKFAAPFTSIQWEEKCGLDLCFVHPASQHILFAYEAEMSIITSIPVLAVRGSALFSEDDETAFYLSVLKDLDKLLHIDSPQLFYLGRVGNNEWSSTLPLLASMISRRVQRTFEASCSPQRQLTVVLTTGRKSIPNHVENYHYAIGSYFERQFSWIDDLELLPIRHVVTG